jgi:hypothetical protein
LDIHASRFQQPASDLALKTHDTSGRLSQPELLQCDQVSVSLKTSRDISALGFPTCCKTWPEWVTERRGAWRQRVNAARLTRGKESSSWPTMHMGSNERGAYYDKTGKGQRYLSDAVVDEQKNWPTANARDWKDSGPTQGNRQNPNLGTAVVKDAANWPTPQANEIENPNKVYRSPTNAYRGNKKVQPMLADVCKHGQAAPASSSSLGSRQGLWLTPRANEPDSDPNFAARNADRGAHCHGTLSSQAKAEQWPTPEASQDGRQGGSFSQKSWMRQDGTPRQMSLAQATKQWATPNACDHKGATSPEACKKWEHRGQNLPEMVVAQWGTPAANDANKQNVMCEVNSKQAGLPKSVGLELQRQWGTPTARDHKSGRGNEERQYKELTPMVERQQSGKLNPRWVETLMGLPIGWTMPSCTSPQTIAPMSCDSSAMALCLPPQSELSEFSLAS